MSKTCRQTVERFHFLGQGCEGSEGVVSLGPSVVARSTMAGNTTAPGSGKEVSELVWWYLPARSIVRFRAVCKEWNSRANSSNVSAISRFRKAGSDWYFPISFPRADDAHPLRAWFGIHHNSDVGPAGDAHKLPTLDFMAMRIRWVRNGKRGSVHPNDYRIEAASGGLLLLNFDNPSVSTTRLFVVNPLTGSTRELCCMNCCKDLGRRNGKLLHAHIVVDASLGTYKIVILTTQCTNVYSSHSKRWACIPVDYFPCRSIQGYFSPVNEPGRVVMPPHYRNVSRYSFPGSAICDGSVFICTGLGTVYSAAFGNKTVIALQIWPMEPGQGQPQGGHLQPVLTSIKLDFADRHDRFLGYARPTGKLKLVVCMNDLYAVISRCDARYSSRNIAPARNIFLMRREIHIIKIQVRDAVRPRIVRHVMRSTKRKLAGRPPLNRLWGRRLHFSCTAKSSVIWVAWEKRLLQYDVVSDVWKLSSHTNDSFLESPDGAPPQNAEDLFFEPVEESGASCLAYTPSFGQLP